MLLAAASGNPWPQAGVWRSEFRAQQPGVGSLKASRRTAASRTLLCRACIETPTLQRIESKRRGSAAQQTVGRGGGQISYVLDSRRSRCKMSK
jgi:hypothetical protein